MTWGRNRSEKTEVEGDNKGHTQVSVLVSVLGRPYPGSDQQSRSCLLITFLTPPG